jgi:hypothetical protein
VDPRPQHARFTDRDDVDVAGLVDLGVQTLQLRVLGKESGEAGHACGE